MKKSCLIFWLGIFALSSMSVMAKEDYVGGKISVTSKVVGRGEPVKDGYGKGVYGKDPTFYGVFYGHKFNERLGLELSYDFNKVKRSSKMLGEGSVLPGNIEVMRGDHVFFDTNHKTENIKVLMHVSYPAKGAILWANAGPCLSRVKTSQTMYGGIYRGAPNNTSITRTFVKSRLVPSVEVGVDYAIKGGFGVRASAEWIQHSLFKVKSKERPDSKAELRLKDSYKAFLGVYYKF